MCCNTGLPGRRVATNVIRSRLGLGKLCGEELGKSDYGFCTLPIRKNGRFWHRFFVDFSSVFFFCLYFLLLLLFLFFGRRNQTFFGRAPKPVRAPRSKKHVLQGPQTFGLLNPRTLNHKTPKPDVGVEQKNAENPTAGTKFGSGAPSQKSSTKNRCQDRLFFRVEGGGGRGFRSKSRQNQELSWPQTPRSFLRFTATATVLWRRHEEGKSKCTRGSRGCCSRGGSDGDQTRQPGSCARWPRHVRGRRLCSCRNRWLRR